MPLKSFLRPNFTGVVAEPDGGTTADSPGALSAETQHHNKHKATSVSFRMVIHLPVKLLCACD
jgi:hypothetical protein